MKKAAIVSLVSFMLWSCGNNPGRNAVDQNAIQQQEDGTISLKIEEAACYFDNVNPSFNTAEWNVVVTKPGRYKVWLSSATSDTLNLDYSSSVKIVFLDSQIEANPECDEIVLNSQDIPYPFYRADSYMGTFSILEPGRYSIQAISDKIIPSGYGNKTASLEAETRIVSLYLKPVTR